MEAFLELPSWLTAENVFKLLDSKIFSAIYWGSAAVVAIVGFIARMKYRDKNLKKLLDAYIVKAQKAEGRERESVKEVMKRAIRKARGLANEQGFHPSDPFEVAARMFAQSQPGLAIEILAKEAITCEATIDYANHRVRLARERAATAYLEIGMIEQHRGRGLEALAAFTSMLRVNPGDLDAFRMRGAQYRAMSRFNEAVGDFIALEQLLGGDRAAVAEVKRELAAVFLGSRDLARAEGVLNQAMVLEIELSSEGGKALTHERIGTVRTARKRWKLARKAYEEARTIFGQLRDGPAVIRLDEQLVLLDQIRNEELRRRREKQKRKTRPAPEPVLH